MSLPVSASKTADWRTIATVYYNTCAIKQDRSLWCWKYEGYRRDRDLYDDHSPVQVGTERDWDSVVVGSHWGGYNHHVCALKSTGSLWCWGDNSAGQLGDGTTVNRSAPVKIGVDAEWQTVVVSSVSTCALKKAGSIWCWGGVVNSGSTPVQVGTDVDWLKIVKSDGYHCALKQSGSLWCLENVASIDQAVFVQVGKETDWNMVAVGRSHGCALKNDHSLWCWGDNRFGQLGNGSYLSSLFPTPVGLATDWQAVSLGDEHSCALKQDGSLWCWGNNASGQLGDGSVWKDTPQPILWSP